MEGYFTWKHEAKMLKATAIVLALLGIVHDRKTINTISDDFEDEHPVGAPPHAMHQCIPETSQE